MRGAALCRAARQAARGAECAPCISVVCAKGTGTAADARTRWPSSAGATELDGEIEVAGVVALPLGELCVAEVADFGKVDIHTRYWLRGYWSG
eukprot:273749-Prymnesium_polylepis.1